MKAMFAGFAAMILIAFGAYFALQEIGFSTQDLSSGANVRLE
ncbi:hypothetical protein [Pacificoceanicola onchidii]|nr:hypothetical protein [Pacificoceanicola onchidii]